MRRLPLLLLFALASLAAGCGSGSSDAPVKAATAPDGAAVIHMRDIAFAPRDAVVRVGQKVRWVNDDTVDHNVIADSGAAFRSRNFGHGGSFTFTPTKPGRITYECDLHPGMTGSLTVRRQ